VYAGAHLDVLRVLVKDLGADVNQVTDPSGTEQTPLSIAVQRGFIDAVGCLVTELGATIDSNANQFRDSPLYTASDMGNLAMVKCLVHLGADVNVQTPLHAAARAGHLDVMRFLVERGALPNKADFEGDTPAMYAAQTSRLDSLRCIVKELGGEVNHENNESETALTLAVSEGNLELMRCLVMELGADVNHLSKTSFLPIQLAARENSIDVLLCLVTELGADVNKVDYFNSGISPLNVAATHGSFDAARLLVKYGADINHANSAGVTPLISAAWEKRFDIAKWLVKAGANPQLAHPVKGTAADISRAIGASSEQTAYLEAKAHCSHPGCSGAGIKKCQGCMQARFCGLPCHMAHWPAHKAECRLLGAKGLNLALAAHPELAGDFGEACANKPGLSVHDALAVMTQLVKLKAKASTLHS
jgi:ankyrin repeat protein